MTKWEYKRVSNYPLLQEKLANQLGKEGWEMIGPINHAVWFKRPVQ